MKHKGNVMEKKEWLERYQQRLVDHYEFSLKTAISLSEAAPFEDMSDGYEDDPEGAADMEMSYAEVNDFSDFDFDIDDEDEQ
jgi:hypothetical protein